VTATARVGLPTVARIKPSSSRSVIRQVRKDQLGGDSRGVGVISLHLEGVAAHWAVIAMSTAKSTSASVVSTLIPARLERLPWGRFHVVVIAAFGITWILDGLEVTLAASVAAALKESPALRFSDHASVHAPAQRAGAQRLRALA
jgi:hypothetical protein